MSSLLVTQDVRVHRSEPAKELYSRAARSAAKFLRRQADARHPENKDELCKLIWKLYWKAERAGMLSAPRATRALLREQYGFWGVVDVKTPEH